MIQEATDYDYWDAAQTEYPDWLLSRLGLLVEREPLNWPRGQFELRIVGPEGEGRRVPRRGLPSGLGDRPCEAHGRRVTDVRVIAEADALDGEDVVPGFACLLTFWADGWRHTRSGPS
jgi:hypothetical protein